MAKLDDLEARRERVALLRSQGYICKQIQIALGLTVGQVRGDVKLFQPQPYDDDVRKLLAENLSCKAIGERLGISETSASQAVYRIKHPRPTVRIRTWKRIPNETRDAIRAYATANPGVPYRVIAKKFNISEKTVGHFTRRRKSPRKTTQEERDAIRAYALANPKTKLRTVARRFGVSVSVAWRILQDRPTRNKRMNAAVEYFKYHSKETQVSIASVFGVARGALNKRLKRQGLERSLLRDEVYKAHRDHTDWSTKQIARVVGCSHSYVRRVLPGLGVVDVPDYSCISTKRLDHAYEIDAKEPPKEFERGIAPLRFPPIFMKQYVKVYYEARKIREEFTPEIRAICEQIKRGELEKEAHMREYRIGQSCGFFERSYNSFWDCVGK